MLLTEESKSSSTLEAVNLIKEKEITASKGVYEPAEVDNSVI